MHQSVRASVAVMNVSTPQDEGSCGGFVLSTPTAPVTESKPPLPPSGESGGGGGGGGGGDGEKGASAGPKPPPRTRPKSWTSSLFNAMSRQNHKSVNFQSVLEEQNQFGGRLNSVASTSPQKYSLHQHTLASGMGDDGTSDPPSHLSEEKLRIPAVQNVLSARGSRTPSPFRTIFKGIVKGTVIVAADADDNERDETFNLCNSGISVAFLILANVIPCTGQILKFFFLYLISGVVHENPQIGSDGESEEGSRHSDTATGASASDPYSSSARGGGGGGDTKAAFAGEKKDTRGGTNGTQLRCLKTASKVCDWCYSREQYCVYAIQRLRQNAQKAGLTDRISFFHFSPD
jgi:hypothetical protein